MHKVQSSILSGVSFLFLIEGNVLFEFKSLRLFRVQLAFSQMGDYGSIILPRGDYGFIIIPGGNYEPSEG